MWLLSMNVPSSFFLPYTFSLTIAFVPLVEFQIARKKMSWLINIAAIQEPKKQNHTTSLVKHSFSPVSQSSVVFF